MHPPINQDNIIQVNGDIENPDHNQSIHENHEINLVKNDKVNVLQS